jgi:hypothetical protein
MKKKTFRTTEEFYEYLRTQFHDLESAKEFYRKWQKNGQEIEAYEDGYTFRAMAQHISNVLENKIQDEDDFFYDLKRGKYYAEIYLA